MIAKMQKCISIELIKYHPVFSIFQFHIQWRKFSNQNGVNLNFIYFIDFDDVTVISGDSEQFSTFTLSAQPFLVSDLKSAKFKYLFC
jgi:hypothetical protein